MENQENLIPKYDKSTWGTGEWNNEPDRKDFIHQGFSCFILRNSFGNWCGYVGVPKGHPYFEKSYDDMNVNVHGGVTYAAKCSPPICHIPEPNMPEEVWWIGFDTAHAGDFMVANNRRLGCPGVYRNMEYIINEVKQLANQLKEKWE